VFDTLIESKHKTKKGQLFGTGMLSLVIHTIIVSALVYATLQAGQGDDKVKVDTAMVYVTQQEQKQPDQPPPPQLDIQLKGFQTVVAPTDIPTNIPPVNLNDKFDPKDFTGVGVEGGTASGIVPTGGEVFQVDVVQEKPEMLSHPPLVYPELLKQAGIEGSVVVRAIVDTSGRIEPNSIAIISSPNPGFDQPARNLVLKSLYRPARVYGRAVRVLIEQPINFQLQHNR
jgi:protein TonB